MADDLNKRGPADRARINVNEAWEVEWWCKQLGRALSRLPRVPEDLHYVF